MVIRIHLLKIDILNGKCLSFNKKILLNNGKSYFALINSLNNFKAALGLSVGTI